jgi:hypothetical protein
MSTDEKVVLEGGPDELAGRVVTVAAGTDAKIEYGSGYEHFRPTARRADTPEGPLPVYVWWERTEMTA